MPRTHRWSGRGRDVAGNARVSTSAATPSSRVKVARGQVRRRASTARERSAGSSTKARRWTPRAVVATKASPNGGGPDAEVQREARAATADVAGRAGVDGDEDVVEPSRARQARVEGGAEHVATLRERDTAAGSGEGQREALRRETGPRAELPLERAGARVQPCGERAQVGRGRASRAQEADRLGDAAVGRARDAGGSGGGGGRHRPIVAQTRGAPTRILRVRGAGTGGAG